jgi:predicted DNA-binding transcriptional regulator YafY
MKADRLIAILIQLQKSVRVTAKELAEELEVSERTIYRDIDALSLAGVPVYTQRGPGGGIALLDSFRTDLTGLNSDELQALMMLTVPAPLRDLGIGADLKSALRKIVAAAQLARRESDFRLKTKFFIDNSEWVILGEFESLFGIIRKALWNDFELFISYYSELGSHAGAITAIVQPLGLVAAAGAWFMVAGIDLHPIVIPLSRLHFAQITAQNFEPPPDFILENFWRDWVIRSRSQSLSILVYANVIKTILPYIEENIEDILETDPSDGWIQVALCFETFEQARTWILGMGNAIEVIAPLSLRLSISDYARQILSVYEHE